MCRTLMQVLLLTGLVLQLSSLTGQVRINGKAPEFAGMEISANKFSDYLTHKTEQLTSTKINEDGNFTLEFELSKVEYVTLDIKLKRVGLYCVRDKVYNISVTANEDLASTSGNIFIRHSFPNKAELNQKVIDFNKGYYDLIENHRKAFVANKQAPLVKKFKDEMMQKYYGEDQGYFNSYLFFNLAMISEGILLSDKSLFDQFFNDKNVQTGNLEYVKLFKQFYKKKFEFLSAGSDGAILRASVESGNYRKMLDIVERDKYVGKNDKLAELLCLYGFSEVYHSNTLYKRRSILKMINHISEKGIHRQIAQNLFWELTNLSKNSKAPDFQLTNSKMKNWN